MTEDATTTAVLSHSVLATARIFVVLLAGFLASKWPKQEPLLTREACHCISRVCALLFQPALVISSTGATLNLADLKDSWQLVVAGGLTICLSFAVAWVSTRLLLGPESGLAFRPVQLAIAFQNCALIPLLLMESLCEQDAIKSDFGDDADECFSQATSMIFLYYASWQVCFYAWGFYALGQDDTLELKLKAQLTRASPAVDDASATISPFESSHTASDGEGTLNDGSSSSSSSAERAIETSSNGSSSSSIMGGTGDTLSNGSSSSIAKRAVVGNDMVDVGVLHLDKKLVAPALRGLRANGMVAADVQIDSVFISPPPLSRANRTVDVDVQLDAALVAPPPRPLSPPSWGLRACDRILPKEGGLVQGGGSGGDECVTGVQQQVVAADDVDAEPSCFRVSPPPARIRACDCNLANSGGHTQGGDGSGYGDAAGVQQLVAVDDANRESSRFHCQGDIVMLPSAAEAAPQGWGSRDSGSSVTASCCMNSMQQQTTSNEENDVALDAPNLQRTTATNVNNVALGTAEAGLGGEENVHVASDAARQQRTTTGEEQNVACATSNQQQTTTSEDNVSLEAANEGLTGGSGAWAKVWQQRIWMVLVSPNIIAVTVGISIAMISPLQDVFFSDPQAFLRPLGAALETLGTPTVATSLLVMAGSLVQVTAVGAGGEKPGGNCDGPRRNWRRYNFIAGGLLVACRLVLVPAIGFAIFWVAAKHSTVLGENRLMRMIMLIELAMPSGAFIIVSLNQLKMPTTAGFMARLYLWQHGASILTITLWTALAVRMLY